MKVSVNWVKEFVDIDLPIDELVKKIGSQLGEVEEVIDLGKKYQGIVVAEVMECERHPNADKLSVCKIDDKGTVKGVERDKAGLVQVICGAPNVRKGLKVAWLPPGSTVPASVDKEPFVLEKREIRGEVSNGMLASASELDLSDDHTGIVELSWEEVGKDFAEQVGLNDYIIDIENKMFTHRPDCFGIFGVAREIAGITEQEYKGPKWPEDPEKRPVESDLDLSVDNRNPELVPRFMAQVIEGIEVGPSPIWQQAYLARVGIRPINNIVDVTNYAMYLTAQPLHAYDYDKLCKVAGTKTAQLETRLSKKGDTLKLLNGKTIKFEDEETILITSNDIPVGIGGVMGGADTEVDETTKNIVLECANFDMYAIRRASMRHGLFTDAVTRFNKGQSPLQNAPVLNRAAGWMSTASKGKGKIGKVVDKHQKLKRPIAVHVTQQFINDRLGLDLGKKEMANILENVEFEVQINGPTLVVTPPYWRMDIEIPEDIVEEVGRLYGYDHLPLELPKRSIKPVAINRVLQLKQDIRQILSSAGATELLTYSFVHGDLMQKVGQDPKYAYKLSNALSPDLQYYRLSITPSLLDKIHPNIKAGHKTFAIFEINKAHKKGVMDPQEKTVPKEEQFLSFVYASADKNTDGAPYYQALTYLERVLNKLGVGYEIRPLTKKDIDEVSVVFEPNRAAVIAIDGKQAGFIGEYTPSVRRNLKLPDYAAGFELSIEPLLETQQPVNYRQLSKYPSVEQDICLRVPANVSYAQLAHLVEKAAMAHGAEEVIDVSPLDIYQKTEDDAHKQITFRVTVTSYDRTLTDKYVNKLLDEVAVMAKKELQAERI